MKMLRTTLFLAMWLAVLLPPAMGQEGFATELVRLREEARELIDRGEPQAACLALDKAVGRTQTEADAYTRADTLRHLAALYAEAGNKNAAATTFAQAMQSALAASPASRRMSGVIGVVEMQRASGDDDGARKAAISAVSAGLFKEVAATGQAGETGRFLTALDGALAPPDIIAILSALRHIDLAALRIRALRVLAETRMAHEAPEREGDIRRMGMKAYLDKSSWLIGDIEALHPRAGEDERIYWFCIRARVYAVLGDSFKATTDLSAAQTLPARLDEKRKGKMRELIRATEGKISQAKEFRGE